HPRLFTTPMETDKLPLRRTRPLRTFRFLSRQSRSPRRTLAHRTKITAPARHDNSLDFRPAPETLLALSAVSSVMLLIFSRHAFRIDKIGNRRSPHADRFQQNLLQRVA